MYVDGWQANATGADVGSVLRSFEAERIETVDDQGAWPSWRWRSYVDSDEDIVNAVSIMVWYNDRTDEEIDDLRATLEDWLARNRGSKAPGVQ